jgi:hypothetical protein
MNNAGAFHFSAVLFSADGRNHALGCVSAGIPDKFIKFRQTARQSYENLESGIKSPVLCIRFIILMLLRSGGLTWI